MNENLRKYIDALRSGEYIQVKRDLKNISITGHNDRCFCAMGLACEVYRLNNPDSAWWRKYVFVLRSDGTVTSRRELEWTQEAPQIVLDWLGISPSEQTVIIGLNDVEKHAFGQIADWLETDEHERFYPKYVEHLHPNYDKWD